MSTCTKCRPLHQYRRRTGPRGSVQRYLCSAPRVRCAQEPAVRARLEERERAAEQEQRVAR
jgi:hypothetical protein